MRLLRILALAAVQAGLIGHGFRSVERGRLGARGRDRLLRERRRIGSHVGDVAVFVQRLGHAHGLARGEAKLAGRLLLQSRGRERRGGAATVRLGGDRRDREGDIRLLQCRNERDGGCLIERCSLHLRLERARIVKVAAGGNTFTVQSHELRSEPNVGRRRDRSKLRDQIPVAGRHECQAFALPVDDESRCSGLHAASREPWPHLPPEHGGHLISEDAVEDAPGFLCVDESDVEVTSVVFGLKDRILRDLMKHHSLHRDLGLEHLQQMPGDGLAFAVLISCEQEFVCVLQCALEIGDGLLLGV